MYRSERENEIIAILEQMGETVSIAAPTGRAAKRIAECLAQTLHISPSSVRRDLSALEKRGLIRRSYGGATLCDSNKIAIPFLSRMQENKREKKRIATLAARLVKEGDVIFVDASSTVVYFLQEITGIRGLTVVTNSIEALHFLSAYQIRVICTGGAISYENRFALTGDTVMEAIDKVRANTAFFSARGIDEDGILYDCYQNEIDITRRMMRCSARSVLLCDSSKIGHTSTFVKGNLSEIDTVVCDINLSEPFGKRYAGTVFL